MRVQTNHMLFTDHLFCFGCSSRNCLLFCVHVFTTEHNFFKCIFVNIFIVTIPCLAYYTATEFRFIELLSCLVSYAYQV